MTKLAKKDLQLVGSAGNMDSLKSLIKSKIHKEYTNVDKEDEDYEEEEWEESDSCRGFYGDIDTVAVLMFDQAGMDINDFNEE